MAWYNYPQINNFGSYPDPVGNYAKPDVNIVAPPGTAFTAPASGTITSIDTSSFFGPSITVQFDTPPNSTARYYAFNYLSSIASGLYMGQHVSTGDILGYGGGNQNNSGGTAAFAFSAGPAYGQGQGWTDNVSGSWINPALDPTNFLSSLATGSPSGKCPGPNDKCTCPGGYSVVKNGIGNPICRNNSFPYNSQSCAECPSSSTDPITAIGNFFSSIQQTTQWLSDPMRIIKLVFGILLIAGSVILIAIPQSSVAMGIKSTARRIGVR